MTRDEFEFLGLDKMAFIKPGYQQGVKVYVVHAADGQPLTSFYERATAFAGCRINDLQPMSVH